MDNYTVQVITTALTGTTTDRTKTETADDSASEEFWISLTLTASAVDTSVTLGGLTDPKALIVIGGEGITFKLGAAGTDAVGADPVAVVGNEGDGLGIAAILLSNAESQARSVQIIAFE